MFQDEVIPNMDFSYHCQKFLLLLDVYQILFLFHPILIYSFVFYTLNLFNQWDEALVHHQLLLEMKCRWNDSFQDLHTLI